MAKALDTFMWATDNAGLNSVDFPYIIYIKNDQNVYLVNLTKDTVYEPVPEFRMYSNVSGFESFCNEIAFPHPSTKEEFEKYMNGVSQPTAYEKDGELFLVSYNGKVAHMHPIGKGWYTDDNLTFDPTGAKVISFEEAMKKTNVIHMQLIEEWQKSEHKSENNKK